MEKKFNKYLIQTLATIGSNIKLKNFFLGRIYTGPGKKLCLPGLNCYSCPGAVGSCPIGSFQAVVGGGDFSISYYVLGLMMFFGVLIGRLICGLLCPFGFFQDLLHKIPSKKFSTKKLKPLRYIKYLIMVLVVWLFGLIFVGPGGLASPYFCKYVCPQGILEAGLPLAAANPGIRASLGPLFFLKLSILVLIIILSVFYYRPFCKWLCPLGAFYSLFNKLSFYQYHVDQNTCISCGKCAKVCKMDVDITENQAALECIRCGDCLRVCPTKAISTSLTKPKTGKEEKLNS
ncbi:MAG: 4Fe-4S binding protein [Bacillota bacterium]|nr:4Fe-4S binding protein [Bacillota bacterium]